MTTQKTNFYWKTASPQERALKLLKEGDSRTAQTNIKIPCCVCEKPIVVGQDYRVFFNNNDWKAHETCVKSGGKNVQQIRGIVKTEDGEQRIFWDQLDKKDTAIMLIKSGKRFTGRANTEGQCCLCGRKVKSGEELVRNSNGSRVAHWEEAKIKKAEAEAQQVATFREAEKVVNATISQPTLKVLPTQQQIPLEQPVMQAQQQQQQYMVLHPEVEAMKAKMLELEKRNSYLEGFRAAVTLMQSGKERSAEDGNVIDINQT